MNTMNISLPAKLRAFVEEQVSSGGYGTSSEYLRELIRRDQDRTALRRVLLDGAESKVAVQANARFFDGLRHRVRTPARRQK